MLHPEKKIRNAARRRMYERLLLLLKNILVV
jgi:hypothetical protein